MRENIELGPVPAMEDPAQVGDANYEERARAEGRAYIGVIRRAFPSLPDGLTLRLKRFPHDFGGYFEVVASYDTRDEAAADAAYMLDGAAPANWDAEARAELGLPPAS